MKLNDKTCKNAKAKEKAYKLADGEGLYLDVKPTGGKLWRLKYRFEGKEKLLSFGAYPIITLAEAREKKIEAKKLLTKEIDPSRHKKEEKRKQELNSQNTFEVIAREWWEVKKGLWTEKHANAILKRLEQDIFPYLGNITISEIKPAMLLDALRKIQTRGANEVSYRTSSICKRIFSYAIQTGKTEYNSASDLKGALKPYKKEHYASINYKELPAFVRCLEQNKARLFRHTILATKMMMLTFVRTSELIEATWNEFDLENATWEIPPERMKKRKAHVIPLSKQTLAILNELKELSRGSKYIFPSQINHHKCMSDNTILKALARMGYKGIMTGHGFRSLALSTIKEQLGYRHEVVDRQLAHAPKDKTDKAYDRAYFLDDRVIMMQEWADYIDNVNTTGEVVQLKVGSM